MVLNDQKHLAEQSLYASEIGGLNASLIFFQQMVQEIEKYIKLHVMGDFGDMRIGISENFQKTNFSSY